MNVYIVDSVDEGQEGYAHLKALHPEPDKVVFDGKRLSPAWNPFSAALSEGTENDCVDLSPIPGALVCNKRAIDILLPALNLEVEVLPIEVDRYKFQIINVVQVIDCLIVEDSDTDDWGTGQVQHIERYALNEDMLKEVYLFKIPQLADSYIYATDKFKYLVFDNHLTGLNFSPIQRL